MDHQDDDVALLRGLSGRRVADLFAGRFDREPLKASQTFEIVFDDPAVVRKFTPNHLGLSVYESPIFEHTYEWGTWTRDRFPHDLIGQTLTEVRVWRSSGRVHAVQLQGQTAHLTFVFEPTPNGASGSLRLAPTPTLDMSAYVVVR